MLRTQMRQDNLAWGRAHPYELLRLRTRWGKMTLPPSCQHAESGVGRCSHLIQSSASLSTLPRRHLAYWMLSFTVGSFGSISAVTILGKKNRHQATASKPPLKGMNPSPT